VRREERVLQLAEVIRRWQFDGNQLLASSLKMPFQFAPTQGSPIGIQHQQHNKREAFRDAEEG
jgi:hypothetical protein